MKINYIEYNYNLLLKKIKPCLTLLLLLVAFSSFGQVSLPNFPQDFETATGAENIATPYIGWQTGQFTTTPPTNDNYFWVLDNTRCNVISGNYSLAVSQNTPATTGLMPQYDNSRANSTLVYYTTPIDATNHTSLTLDFNWICEGEIGFDFGTVIYSLDGTTWSTLPGFYEGQATIQSANLDLSVLDGQIFYLGFAWENDRSIEAFPSFIIDDIDVQGIQLTPCTIPNQPTALSLTSTGDTVSGSFNNAIPVPSNYLVVRSPSPSVAPTPVNGTVYNIGDPLGTGTVVDIDSDTLFTATGLNPSTTYDIYIFSYNTACLGAPTYNPTNPLSGTASTTSTVYCTPSTAVPGTLYINNVEFLGTLNDVSNLTNGFSSTPSGYQDFTGLTNSIQEQGEGVNVFVGSNGAGAARFKAWVDWNKNGVFDNPSEIVYDSNTFGILTTTFGFVIPANQPIGDYRIRIRIYSSAGGAIGDFTPCEAFAGNGPNRKLGEAEDYLFTVVESCSAKITSITNGSSCGAGAVDLVVTGSPSSTGYNWYDAETGGNLAFGPGASATISPVLTTTTTFWVTATDGNCESLKRTKIVATINPITSLTFTPANPTVCGENDIITLSATGDTETAFLIDEDFESGGLGVFNSINTLNAIVGGTVNGAAIDDLTRWQNRTSTFVPADAVWFPAISSGFGTNSFVMSTSDVNPIAVWETLQSPSLDASTFTSLTLNFDIYFSKYFDGPTPAPTEDEVLIYVSTGGPRILIASYTDDIGNGTNFMNLTVDLTAYNSPTLTFSIDYSTNVDENSNPLTTSGSFGWNDGVAIDNIKLFGERPLTPSFTWTGSPAVDAYTDATATTPYVSGTSFSTVYVKPTLAQLELDTFTFTANATLSNGCVVGKDINITNNTKIYKGGGSDWDDPTSWKPNGVPTADNCVIILSGEDCKLPNNTTIPIPPILYNAYAKNITVQNSGVLDILTDNYLTVTDWVNVNTGGDLNIKSGGSLIQVTDVVTNNNTGNINMERTVPTGVDPSDYVYWSSPTDEDFNVTDISSATGERIYVWNPTTDGINYGDWIPASGIMSQGRGYIVRGLIPTVPLPANTTEFIGLPQNGIVKTPITRGTYDGPPYQAGIAGSTRALVRAFDDNWNLIGNPYPSAIAYDEFVKPANNPHIEGTIYFWTHANTPIPGNGSPFYSDFGSNYNNSDYIDYNSTGANPPGSSSGNIAAGQAFFVEMLHATPSTSENITFNNTMRSETIDNSQFIRTNESSQPPSGIEKHRIWLDLVDSDLLATSILVGYIEGATNSKDRIFDGHEFAGTDISFYSLIEEEGMSIQGRSLPFDENDAVSLGLFIPETGNYTIAINTLDGLFEDTNQAIYLEDTYNGIIHDLRISPFSFNSDEGTFDDRFILRYNDRLLNIEDYEISGLEILAPNNSFIKVKSGNSLIKTVIVYDLLGRALINKPEINASEISFNNHNFSEGTYIVKAILTNGKQKIQKVVLKH